MLRVRHPKGKTEVTLGNFQMLIDTKEINPDRLAHALEMLTNNYTRTQEIHIHTLQKLNTMLYDYAQLKKEYTELKEKYEPDAV